MFLRSWAFCLYSMSTLATKAQTLSVRGPRLSDDGHGDKVGLFVYDVDFQIRFVFHTVYYSTHSTTLTCTSLARSISRVE